MTTSKTVKKQHSIDTMPEEVIIKILTYLNKEENLKSAISCKLMWRLANSNPCWLLLIGIPLGRQNLAEQKTIFASQGLTFNPDDEESTTLPEYIGKEYYLRSISNRQKPCILHKQNEIVKFENTRLRNLLIHSHRLAMVLPGVLLQIFIYANQPDPARFWKRCMAIALWCIPYPISSVLVFLLNYLPTKSEINYRLLPKIKLSTTHPTETSDIIAIQEQTLLVFTKNEKVFNFYYMDPKKGYSYVRANDSDHKELTKNFNTFFTRHRSSYIVNSIADSHRPFSGEDELYRKLITLARKISNSPIQGILATQHSAGAMCCITAFCQLHPVAEVFNQVLKENLKTAETYFIKPSAFVVAIVYQVLIYFILKKIIEHVYEPIKQDKHILPMNRNLHFQIPNTIVNNKPQASLSKKMQ